MKVSFCVTYYNQSGFVSQSLDSILALEMPCAYEILVGDDGSSDDTATKVREYQSRFPDKIRLFVMPREAGSEQDLIRRASANRLNLVEHATGDFVMFLDGDDHYCATGFIPKALSALAHDGSLVACAFGYQLERPGGIERPHLPREGFSVEEYVRGVYIHSGAFVFRNVFSRDRVEFLKKSEAFDDNVITLYALQFGGVVYVDEPVYGYRQSDGSIWNSISDLERDLLNAEDYHILSSVVPKFKAQILRRQWSAIERVWRNRRMIRKILGDDAFDRRHSDICRRHDCFLLGCMDWNDLSLPQKAMTYADWCRLKARAACCARLKGR